MTIEEAIDYLTALWESGGITVNEAMALGIAIKSLETCEKIKEEIETEIKAYDETVTFHRGIRIGLKIAEEFIDKHLLEVSE